MLVIGFRACRDVYHEDIFGTWFVRERRCPYCNIRRLRLEMAHGANAKGPIILSYQPDLPRA
ncbi:hypothetical protein BJX65DRAFT_308459 [Aspergillus insuetus]